MTRSRGWYALAAFGLLSACTEVKNDKSKSSSSDTVKDGGLDAEAGSDASGAAGSGGALSSDQGSAAKGGGSAAGSGGTGGKPPTGSVSRAPAGAGGSGGMPAPASGAGAPAPMHGEVTGKAMDFWRQPIEAAQVTIGDKTVKTDAQGNFRIPDVPPTYDVTLLINATMNGEPKRAIWRYEGLTRRDPSLQAYSNGTTRGAWLDVRVAGVNFMRRGANDIIRSSYGGPSGEFGAEDTRAATERIRIVWQGPLTTRFTAHALRMTKLADRIEPDEFIAYSTTSFEISAEGEVRVDHQLADGLLPRGSVNGKVTGPPGSQRAIVMYMRFPDHAILELLYDPTVTEAFNYFIPSMPADARISLVASQSSDGHAMVHMDDLNKDSQAVELKLPSAARPLTPVGGINVDLTTTFTWESEPKVFVFAADIGRDSAYVVTTKKEARLPIAATFEYTPGQKLSWRIETHGSFASTDDATGAEGVLDTLGLSYRPRGPSRGSGTYTESTARDVTFTR